MERAKPRQKKMDQHWISRRRGEETQQPTQHATIVAEIEWNRRGSNVGDRTDGFEKNK